MEMLKMDKMEQVVEEEVKVMTDSSRRVMVVLV